MVRHFGLRYCRRSPPFLLRGASFVGLRTPVPAWLHPFVEHPYDLHEARPNDAVEYNADRLSHSRLTAAGTRMPEMKASNSARQLAAVLRRSAVRLSRDFAHSGREERRIPALAFEPATFGSLQWRSA